MAVAHVTLRACDGARWLMGLAVLAGGGAGGAVATTAAALPDQAADARFSERVAAVRAELDRRGVPPQDASRTGSGEQMAWSWNNWSNRTPTAVGGVRG